MEELKLSEENIGEKLHGTGFDNDFLQCDTPKAWQQQKISSVEMLQNLKFQYQRTQSTVKSNWQNGRKYFQIIYLIIYEETNIQNIQRMPITLQEQQQKNQKLKTGQST